MMNSWPFPPITGPIPWTPAQQTAYKKQQQQQLPDAPF